MQARIYNLHPRNVEIDADNAPPDAKLYSVQFLLIASGTRSWCASTRVHLRAHHANTSGACL